MFYHGLTDFTVDYPARPKLMKSNLVHENRPKSWTKRKLPARKPAILKG